MAQFYIAVGFKDYRRLPLSMVIVSVCVIVLSCKASAENTRRTAFLLQPNRLIICKENSTVSLGWNYSVNPENTELLEIHFGKWNELGYISERLMAVWPNDNVLVKPSYKNKLAWKGSVSSQCPCSTQFTFRNINANDDGKYGIHFEFGLHKRALVDTITLVVHTPPVFVNKTVNQLASEGNSTVLLCTAKGKPAPVIQLLKHNDVIKNSTGEMKYPIDVVKEEHFGMYSCRARNYLGMDEKRIYLEVERWEVIPRTGNDTGPRDTKPGNVQHRQAKHGNTFLISMMIVGTFVCLVLIIIGGFLLKKRCTNSEKQTIPTEGQPLKTEKTSDGVCVGAFGFNHSYHV